MLRMFFDATARVAPFLVVFWLLKYMLVKQEKKEEKRKEEQKRGIIRTNYIVKSEKILLIIFIMATVMFGGAVVYGIIIKEDLWVNIGLAIFAITGLSGMLNMAVWKIEVNGEEIIWRSTFGRKRKFRFEDITKCVIKNSGAIRVYVHDKRLFTIDSNIDCKEFMDDVERRGIPVRFILLERYKKKTKKRW